MTEDEKKKEEKPGFETLRFKGLVESAKGTSAKGDWVKYNIKTDTESGKDVNIQCFGSVGANKGLKATELQMDQWYLFGVNYGDYEGKKTRTAFWIKKGEKPDVKKGVKGDTGTIIDFDKICTLYNKKITGEKRCFASFIGIATLLYPGEISAPVISTLKDKYKDLPVG